MKGSRFTEEQIIGILKQQEAGKTVAAICRESGVSEATFYKWKSRYGGRQCLHIEVDTSLTGERVARVLTELVAHKGKPQVLQIDNGPEFRGKILDWVPPGHGLSK